MVGGVKCMKTVQDDICIPGGKISYNSKTVFSDYHVQNICFLFGRLGSGASDNGMVGMDRP